MISYGRLIINTLLFVGVANISTGVAASYKDSPLSCRADQSLTIVSSVDAKASFRLGQNYELGDGVAQDLAKAYSWFCNGALQQHPDSELQVAMMLLEGKGVAKNLPLGLEWMNRAARKGNHAAELALGILVVESDPMRSAVLFKRAAAAGDLYANHRLAELYYYGMGVPQDYPKAEELSELGVAAGFNKSRELITRIRLKRESAEKSRVTRSKVINTPSYEVTAPVKQVAVNTTVAKVKEPVKQVVVKQPPKKTVTADVVKAKFTALDSPVRDESFLRTASWMNEKLDSRYSIQLVQASQLDGILKFMRKHKLERKAYYIHAQRDGQYRYILLYGDYPNNKTAKASAQSLPKAVKDSGYWVRSYKDVKASYVISN